MRKGYGEDVSPGTHPWRERVRDLAGEAFRSTFIHSSAPSAYSKPTGRMFLESSHPGIVLHVSLLEARLRSL